jgi:hypothetical protein
MKEKIKLIAGANPNSVRFPVLGEDVVFIDSGSWANREAALDREFAAARAASPGFCVNLAGRK